jgi:hypothetical protein
VLTDGIKFASENAGIDFVFAELTVGITFCRIVRTQRQLGLEDSATIQQAQKALAVATRSMHWLRHRPEFERMKAQAERLRVELAALKPTCKAPL